MKTVIRVLRRVRMKPSTEAERSIRIVAVAVTTRLFSYAADDLAFREDRDIVAEQRRSLAGKG